MSSRNVYRQVNKFLQVLNNAVKKTEARTANFTSFSLCQISIINIQFSRGLKINKYLKFDDLLILITFA